MNLIQHTRLYLTIALIFFTLIFSVVIGLVDYYKGQKQIHANHKREVEIIENAVVQSLHTVDQMYNFTDSTLKDEMKEGIDYLAEKYTADLSFQQWDFQQLKEELGMDIYIIDDENTIIYSSFEKDVGLNFNECCGSFGDVIENRRLGGEFKHDLMDLQQSSGEIKKFAYMPTYDQKYLIELSLSLEDNVVFEMFDIFKKMKELEEEYKPIHSIRVYHPTGISFKDANETEELTEIAEEMRPVFEAAKRENERKEKIKEVDGEKVTYRYIPYIAEYEQDYPMTRIVEIVYNDVELEGILKFYREGFIYQQFIILLAVVLLAIFIGKVIAKPIHLAFHDSLTNLKNRAAFEIEGDRRLKDDNQEVSLMMIDIDNFKQVNDQLGHLTGDRLLVDSAKLIEKQVQSRCLVARVGGDEFVIICSNRNNEELTMLAKSLLHELNTAYESLNQSYSLGISISIGIAYAKVNEELKDLYDKADQALYQAKKNGKNQYQFYENMLL